MGAYLQCTLLRDKAGNLYGTTGTGTVFKLAPDGAATLLYVFGGADFPVAGVISDKAGNL